MPDKSCKRCGLGFTPAPANRMMCGPCREPRCPDCGRKRPVGRAAGRCVRCAGIALLGGHDVNVVEPTKAPAPTPARPGSPEKVAVLAARYGAGEFLWHEGDAGND